MHNQNESVLNAFLLNLVSNSHNCFFFLTNSSHEHWPSKHCLRDKHTRLSPPKASALARLYGFILFYFFIYFTAGGKPSPRIANSTPRRGRWEGGLTRENKITQQVRFSRVCYRYTKLRLFMGCVFFSAVTGHLRILNLLAFQLCTQTDPRARCLQGQLPLAKLTAKMWHLESSSTQSHHL